MQPTTATQPTFRPLGKYAELFETAPTTTTTPTTYQPEYGFGARRVARTWTPAAHTTRQDVPVDWWQNRNTHYA